MVSEGVEQIIVLIFCLLLVRSDKWLALCRFVVVALVRALCGNANRFLLLDIL